MWVIPFTFFTVDIPIYPIYPCQKRYRDTNSTTIKSNEFHLSNQRYPNLLSRGFRSNKKEYLRQLYPSVFLLISILAHRESSANSYILIIVTPKRIGKFAIGKSAPPPTPTPSHPRPTPEPPINASAFRHSSAAAAIFARLTRRSGSLFFNIPNACDRRWLLL